MFKGSQFEPGDRRPIAEHVMTGASWWCRKAPITSSRNYGDANAVVRSDIRVQAGKLTDVTVTHRAAAITLKLVAEKGGEALANTAWSVLTPGGDVIKESIGAFPRVILAEGEYRAIARNEGKVFEREFKVVTGVDGDVEVLAQLMADSASHSAIEDFAALDLAIVALLLDVDGTLIDIGPSPFEVHVPEALCRSLARLLERDGRRAGAGERPADPRYRQAVLAAQAAGGRRPRRRNALARRRGHLRRRSPCRKSCASGWRSRRRRAPASWSRTRAIRSRCITARRRSRSRACAS